MEGIAQFLDRPPEGFWKVATQIFIRDRMERDFSCYSGGEVGPGFRFRGIYHLRRKVCAARKIEFKPAARQTVDNPDKIHAAAASVLQDTKTGPMPILGRDSID